VPHCPAGFAQQPHIVNVNVRRQVRRVFRPSQG
jgi:hypothetical protein